MADSMVLVTNETMTQVQQVMPMLGGEIMEAIERVKTNVEKEVGDRIREYNLSGVKVDEDFKRYYPYGTLASRVLGFTGGDNQGIIGLEVKYEDALVDIWFLKEEF